MGIEKAYKTSFRDEKRLKISWIDKNIDFQNKYYTNSDQSTTNKMVRIKSVCVILRNATF